MMTINNASMPNSCEGYISPGGWGNRISVYSICGLTSDYESRFCPKSGDDMRNLNTNKED